MITLSKIYLARLQKCHDLQVYISFSQVYNLNVLSYRQALSSIRVDQLMMDIFYALQVMGPAYMREGENEQVLCAAH